jgi:hypothetical protein
MRRIQTWTLVLLGLAILAGCGKDPASPNQNPAIASITADPGTLIPGGTASITVTATDPDGDPLTYSYTATGGTITGNGPAATFTAGNTPGPASVVVTVTDGRGGVATASTALTIQKPPPQISVSAQTLQAQGGGECLAFTAVPSENVILVSVKITDPINQFVTFNLGSVTVVAGQAVPLQAQGACYLKRSGTWKFEFTGNRPGGEAFVALATYVSQ